MEYLFKFYFSIMYLCLTFIIQYIYISVIQFNSYKYRKFFTERINAFRRNIFVYFFFLILMILVFVFKEYFNNILLSICMLIQGMLLIVFYAQEFKLYELVFTKRILRLTIVISLLDLIFLVALLCWFSLSFLTALTLLIVVVAFVIFSFSFLILIPIEKLIGKRFIARAKAILASNKNLIKIGITGSYAKTSVKEILNAILSENFNVISTPKSYNTPYGITKTIISGLSNSSEVFVCEMGAKKKGEILELCEMVNVTRGIITSVGHQHTDTFGGIENVYSTKKELADYLRNNMCVFNLMNKFTRKMYFNYVGRRIGCFVINTSIRNRSTKILKKVSKTFVLKRRSGIVRLFLLPHKNNYYAKINKMTEFGSVLDIYYSYKKLGTVTTTLLGKHNVINVVMAFAMAYDMGVPFYKIQKALVTLKSISARLEKFVTNKGAVVINNGYNSNINSARSSLGVLNLFEKRTKVVITPGLIETNDDFTYNRALGEMIGEIADEVIIVKEKNRSAILAGLSKVCFDMSKVYFVNSFFDAKGVISLAGEDYVFLIENDLPNYYK